MTYSFDPASGDLLPVVDGKNLPIYYRPKQYTSCMEDFIKGTKESQIGRIIESSGGGSDLNINDMAEAAHPGILRLATSGSTAKVTWILAGSTSDPTDDGAIRLGGGAWYFEWGFKLSALSDATDNYTIYCGLMDRIPGGAPVDSLYFSYNHAVNSGNWVITAANASTATTANSSTAAVADWQRLGIFVNADASVGNFYINGVEVANSPLTSNLPTTNTVGPGISMIRSASSTARYIFFDYFYYSNVMTTSR